MSQHSKYKQCPDCGSRAEFVPQYRDYYCHSCGEYLGEELAPESPFPVTMEGERKHWNKPHQDQISVWTLETILAGGFFFIMLLVMGASVLVTAEANVIAACGVCLLLALVVPIALSRWWAGRVYDNYGFAFTDEKVYVKKGVYTKFSSAIDYTRVQDVLFTQGIVERHYGLYTVHISTAGGAHNEGIINGIKKPKKIIEFVLARARAAKAGDSLGPSGGDNSGAGRPSRQSASVSSDAVLQELQEMNKLLRRIHDKL